MKEDYLRDLAETYRLYKTAKTQRRKKHLRGPMVKKTKKAKLANFSEFRPEVQHLIKVHNLSRRRARRVADRMTFATSLVKDDRLKSKIVYG